MFSFFSKTNASYEKLAYEFSFKSIDGGKINLQNYKDNVIIVVNVASRCGFTNQYEDLQNLCSKYKNTHRVVIGKDGKVADTFSSITKPSSQRFINLIEKEIKN